MTAEQTLRAIGEVGIVPVIRARSSEEALAATRAVLEGGIPIAEITMTVPGALDVIRALRREFGDRVRVGAGTVLSPEMAAHCISAGAEFIVSPGLDVKTIELCAYYDKAVCPGALTPTEVITALHAGASLVKVFPCSAVGGPKYLRALRGPLPDAQLIPTGGVNLSTAEAYLCAGAFALGVGSELVDPALLRSGETAAISKNAERLSALVRETRRLLSRREVV